MTHEEQDVFVPFANGATVVAMPMPPAAPPPPPQDAQGNSRTTRTQDAPSQDAGPSQPHSAQGQEPRRQEPQRRQPPPQDPPAQPQGQRAVPGHGLPDQVRGELHELFLRAGGQLQSTYLAHISRPDLTSPTALLPYTDCATAGAVSSKLAVINAVFQGRRPGGPSTARQTASAVRAMLRTAPDAARSHLTGVLAMLDELASDPGSAQREDAELGASAGRLEDRLHTSPGVYVYTYPHYWRHPYVPGTERRLLKVGRTDFTQVRTQSRQIGAPEDPLLLRVYPAADPGASERTFHRLLDAAEHTRGDEWFSTTLEFCDEIATALRLEILEADVPA